MNEHALFPSGLAPRCAPQVFLARSLLIIVWLVIVGCSKQLPTAPLEQDVQPQKKPADWCAGHGVPESKCTICNPGLIASFKKSGDWCAEHKLPESVCPKCNPGPLKKKKPRPADWCAGHGVPESKCTICNPGLIASFKKSGDWCAEHKLPESVCPKCNPGPLKKKKPRPADWCAGHGLPESKCTKCNPGLIASFKKSGDWCAAHQFPESVCPSCNPVKPPSGQKKPTGFAPGTKIRFRSIEIERSAGIKSVPVSRIRLGGVIKCTARVVFDRNRLAEIRSPLPGLVHSVKIDLGQKVTKGDPLFVLSSAEIGRLVVRLRIARKELLVAKSNLDRQIKLRRSGVASQRDVELARLGLAKTRSTLASIRQSMAVGGITISKMAGYFKILAPITATVIARKAVVGTEAGPKVPLATLADTSKMWVMLDISEWDASQIRRGQTIALRVDGIAARVFRGKVTWISSTVDPTTRFVRARAEIENRDGVLRANQFGRAEIQVNSPKSGVSVPLSSLQRLSKGVYVLFVRLGPGEYEPRSVQPGRSNRHAVQVTGNIKPGDLVVTTGAFLLRTELNRDGIGAGCCEVNKPGGK